MFIFQIRLDNKFCVEIAYIYELEGRELRVDLCHSQIAYENGIL